MRESKKRGKKPKIFFKLIVTGGITLTLLGLGAGTLAFLFLSRNLPSIEEISARKISESTKIYDRTGKILLYEISNDKKRTVVRFEEIPQFLKDATIVIEDENFWNGPPFDWRGIIRAFFVNITKRKIVQGGSTITQQLARNAFLNTEKTISRKIKELILAFKLSKSYSKEQILAYYLNEIPYGPTTYGVESASQLYFGKSVKELNLAESAILAALPKGPSYYSPWGNHQDELFARQQFILKKMRKAGIIDEEELERALRTKVNFTQKTEGIRAPHFVIMVQDALTQKYGEEMVREGGLKVITTLDWELQTIAEKVVKEGAVRNTELYKGYNAALVAEDPKTGQILALVGSRDYFASSSLPEGCISGVNCKFEPKFNVASQGLRQPGSALKPFVYLTAFQKGYSPETVVFDLPTEFVSKSPNCPAIPDFSKENKNNECFHPMNFDEKFRGPVSLKQALAQSINVPAVKVLYLADIKDTIKTLNDFGITTLKDPSRYGLSLVLGGGEVKLIELVGAYSTLADEGIKHNKQIILEVKNSNGEVLESYKDKSARVVDRQYPRLINNILSDIELRAGLFGGSLPLTIFKDQDVSLKTGTTNDYRDAWAFGYTPSLVVGVWAGNNDNTPMQKSGSSILAAVPIWSEFMKEALKNKPPETFAKPEPVIREKPVLAGNFIVDNQIHSILYYVDKNNPLGPPPENPYKDPQFENWETSIAEWVKTNKDKIVSLITDDSSIKAIPFIEIKEPKNGSFFGNQINISADITASSDIKEIKIYWNGDLLNSFLASSTKKYNFNWSFFPQDAQLQNILEIEARDSNNLASKKWVILYK